MIISEVNSFVDLVLKVTCFANRLQDGWYKGSAEVDSFRDQVLMLTQKHYQWSAQLRRHGLSEDEHLLKAIQAAILVLDKQEKYVNRLEKSRFWRLTRKAFPGKLSYSLSRILAIVDAGPHLLAGRVNNYDLMERSRAQTPAPLPFIADPNYVPISKSIQEIRQALEDQEGPRVVTLFGGPGLGKSSVVKYLALHYHKEKSHLLTETQPKSASFPDGVFYLFCGKGAQDRVKQLQLELLECLGFGTGSAAPPNDLVVTEVQERVQVPSHRIKLRSCLAQQKLLIVLDDLWEGEVLQQLLVPATGVKYLITSQMREIWGPAARIQMRNPTMDEARQILSNYTKGLPIKGKFPKNIQSVADAIVRELDYHPLSLADIGNSINSTRATDSRHWKAISDNIRAVLDENDTLQGRPVVYDQPYNLTVKASMMLMVEALRPEAQRLLFLIALLGGRRLSETLLKYFYKFVESHQKSDLLWKYNNQEKYLEERSLVELHHNSGSESTLIAHGLRVQYIREHRTGDVRSLASHILASSDEGRAELIQMGDAESTLVTILSAVYFTKPFKDVAINSFKNHCRILNDGVISRNISSDMDPLDLVKRRNEIQELVPLLTVHDGDHEWEQQAHEYAKKIIIKLACQGRLDDYSMARLLQLPQTASTGCAVLWLIFGFPQGTSHPHLDESTKTFSATYGMTMNALLTLFEDDATSIKTRVVVASTLMCVLDFESKDTIVNVVSKYTKLLAMDSNPTLQTHLAANFAQCPPATRGVMITGEFITLLDEFTTVLEVLMGLLVFGKDCQVRVSAGRTLNRFCEWKCTALKIAAIPDALDNLFDLFLLKNSLPIAPISGRLKSEWAHSPSFSAGYLLGGLSSMEENRIRFGAVKSGLDGVGNILSTMEGTWRSIGEEDEREQLEKRASIAARILGEVGLEKELRGYIGSLPGVEGGLLFLQTVEMARVLTRDMDSRVTPMIYHSNATRALAILFSNYSNPRSRDVPSVEQLQEVISRDRIPPAKPSSAAEDVCQSMIHWARVRAHIEMGAYKVALEDLAVAQHHFDQIPDVSLWHTAFWQAYCDPGFTRYSYWRHGNVMSSTRIFLQAMLEDHAMLEDYAGTLVGTNTDLIQRGIVRRLSRDLKGALDDFNAAYQLHDDGMFPYFKKERYDILKHRGYVKYLIGDDVGAKEDAEAAEKMKSSVRVVEATIDAKKFWDLEKLPINYLGYFL